MRRIGLIAAGAAVIVLAVLAVAQLVLPGIAAQRLGSRLGRSGTVLSVKVSAFPAIELLWHRADRVVIRMESYRAAGAALGVTLGQVANVGSLDASAQVAQLGLLTVHDAMLRKRGSSLTGSAMVLEDDLRRAVPFLEDVQPIASGGGRLTLRGTVRVLGVAAAVDATVAAANGEVVVAPDVPFGGLATIRLFSDPRVYVESVEASTVAGGFAVSGVARVR